MKEEFKYTSTPDGSAPSGRKKKGTYRDVSLVRLPPEEIDAIDTECLEKGITRRQWAFNLLGVDGDRKKFYSVFSRTNEFSALVKNIGKELDLNEP